MSSGPRTVRKFPPPCWTRDEALVLIEAYSERWHALQRAYLRNPDWDTVAEKLNTAFPDVTPPKTAAQCRHKMEKLRQRHRVEKTRAAGFPAGSFFSTWFYYEAMERMENGSNSTQPGVPDPGHQVRVQPKPINVQKFPSLAPKHRMKATRVSNQDYYQESNSIGFRVKPSMTRQEESESGRPGLRPRKFSKVVIDNDNDNDNDDENGEMWMKVPYRPNALKGKWRNEKNEKNSVPNGKNVNKKEDGIADVVKSIRILGDGFMKVEKMKIDMAMEIEEMRMESEMKRNKLMLESQKLIVDAFVEGLVKYRKVQTRTRDV